MDLLDTIWEADTSATDLSLHSPVSDVTETNEPHGAVPCPGNTYIITERSSGKAITLTEDKLCIQYTDAGRQAKIRWHCVETNGYFGFYNPDVGTYIGHDGHSAVIASAREHKGWECITPRMHPAGGYQLLMPLWSDALLTVVVAEDGCSLVRRRHGTTLWDFLKV